MISRGSNFKQFPLDIVGSSSFGRYPKISASKTYNMFQSSSEENAFMVPYPGYRIGIPSSQLGNGSSGRGAITCVKFNAMCIVIDENVYLISLVYNQQKDKITQQQISLIGTLKTATGVVYIAENNRPQIVISDGINIYVYDPQYTGVKLPFTVVSSASISDLSFSGYTFTVGDIITLSTGTGGSLPSGLSAGVQYYVSASSIDLSSSIQLTTNITDAYSGQNPVVFNGTTGSVPYFIDTRPSFSIIDIDFKPGQLTYHDTYIIVAATRDVSQGAVLDNTWRLSLQNNATQFPPFAQFVGLIETKPDITQAVARLPSGGNMIFVFGKNLGEPWFNEGANLFPYERNNQYNSDYGCASAATVTWLDNIIVWLAINEKSGPIIMFSTGSYPEKITTDGIDFLFSQLQNPQDSQAFLYRQDGHLIYHINFYSDNISFFYDFNTQKFYNACDANRNYYHISQIMFYNNQYFGISKDSGEFYIFDTTFYTYQQTDSVGNVTISEIPRIRICQELRYPGQYYFIINDAGFTIESGETDYVYENRGPSYWGTQPSTNFISDESNPTTEYFAGPPNNILVPKPPKVSLRVSYDGGASFSHGCDYDLFPIGKRVNKLQWWQLGMTNNAVLEFTFWSIGRVVVTNGEVWVRI